MPPLVLREEQSVPAQDDFLSWGKGGLGEFGPPARYSSASYAVSELLSKVCRIEPGTASHPEFGVLSFLESVSVLEVLTGPDVDGAVARELIHPWAVVNCEVVVSHLSLKLDEETL